MEQMINDRANQLTERAMEDWIRQATKGIGNCALVALHDEFGFGHKRAKRFLDKLMTQFSSILSGHMTWEELDNFVKEKLEINQDEELYKV